MAFHKYNEELYNVPQYNADANTWIQRLTETITSADARIDQPNKALPETITLTDAKVMSNTKGILTETILATDTITKSITNKGLAESIRINDWIEIKRKTDSPNWSN